ncbi:dolichyl-phosphate mannosyltransferase 2 regulatory subunit [Pilobolus umbonatus]|nr:dolichyl-phosphate mannosyltransferase 2 regulatory subunit [Pilobolus umbonatus]
MATDKTVGTITFFTTLSIFTYYTVWVLIMPFVDEGHPSQQYFPAWKYAIEIPVLIMIAGLTVIFTFLALIMIKSKKQ